MHKIKIDQEDKQEYKDYLSYVGIFKAVRIFIRQVVCIMKVYIKLPKKKKEKAYIFIYYDAADFPILTINWS